MIESSQIEAQQQLGAPVAEYQRMKKSSVVYTILPPILILFGLGITVGGILNRGNLVTLALSLVMALVFFGPGIWLGLLGWRERDLRIQTFTDGMIYTANKKQTIVRWDDVVSVLENVTAQYVRGVYVGTLYQYTIELLNGAKVRTSERLGGMDLFSQTIKNEVFRRRFPEAMQKYQAGESLQFGKFIISRQGINNGKETLPWSEIKEVSVDQGAFKISKQGGKATAWGRAPVSKTPNYFVLMALINQMLETK